MKFEILRWYRSKSFVVAFIISAISGIVSPLSAYYADEILKKFGGNTAKIIMPDPTWATIILSYLKNVQQLVLFILVFLVASKCYLGKNKSLKLFYTTRANSASQIFLPRLIVGVIVSALAIIIGNLCAFYMTWVFFDNKIDVQNLMFVFGLNMIVILAFIILGAVIGIWWSSPFLAAVFIEVLVLVSGTLNNTKLFKNWSPTTFLMPEKLINNSIDVYQVIRILCTVLIIVILSFLSLRFKMLRHKVS